MTSIGSEQPLESDSDYRRAFERIKQVNKKLTRELTKLEGEIKQRCQSYMVEIARLKQAKPEIKRQSRIYELQIVPRLVDVKVVGRNDDLASMEKTVSKLDQSECETQPATKYSRVLSKEFDLGESTRLTNQTSNTFLAGSRQQQPNNNQQIEKLQSELVDLRKRQQQREERYSRTSDRLSSSTSVAEEQVPEHEVSVEAFKRFYQQQKRYFDEKLYIYEAVFVNIYNMLMKDNSSMKMVEEIRTVQYDELSVKLKTLFSLIRINQDNVQLIQREKDQLLRQMEYLSGRVQELSRAITVKHEAGTQTHSASNVSVAASDQTSPESPRWSERPKVQIHSQSYSVRLRFCRDLNIPLPEDTMDELEKRKRDHIKKIRELYESDIERKYKEIAKIKAAMHSMLEQLNHCVYSSEGLTKVLKIDKDTIEEDTDEPNENPFVKRSYVRRRLTKRTTSTNKDHLRGEAGFDKQDALVLDVLRLNKRIAAQARISRVSEVSEQEDENERQPLSLQNSRD